jgi:hypothetical protein
MLSTSNHSIIIPTVANTGPVISRRGTDNVFVELSFQRSGPLVEMIATRVEYDEYTGRYIREELGREEVEEEDAENAAIDLEWIALKNLDETNNRGYADPCGFGEAVEKELIATDYVVAAE